MVLPKPNRSPFLLPPPMASFLSLLPFLLLLQLSSAAVYDQLLTCLTKANPSDKTISSIVYSPTNASYAHVLQSYIRNKRFNSSTTPKPSIIITPVKNSHVSSAVLCSKKLGVQLKIRSGGHDYDGLSYISDVQFFMLDMFNFKTINVDIASETAWVGAGATLGELYYRIYEKSKVHGFPAGVCPTVGVGGHLSGGGYGTMLRKYGLSIDNVIDAKIVDAKGRVLNRKSMGEDLFWAIRGGGGASFGVILGYQVKLVSVPEVTTVFRIEKYLDQAQNMTQTVYKWLNVADKIDNDLFIRLLLQPVTSKVNPKNKTVRASFVSMFLGDCASLVTITDRDFPELGLKKENCMEGSWIESMLYWANFDNGTAPEVFLDRNTDGSGITFGKRKSDYIQKPITTDNLEWIWQKLISLGKVGFVFNPYGGKMSEIPADATAFPHRAGNICKIQYSISWSNASAAADDDAISQTRQLHSFMTPFVSSSPRGAFINYRDVDIGINHHGADKYEEGKVYGSSYFMGNFDRLVKIKTMVDPDDFFWYEQSIPTLPQ